MTSRRVQLWVRSRSLYCYLRRGTLTSRVLCLSFVDVVSACACAYCRSANPLQDVQTIASSRVSRHRRLCHVNLVQYNHVMQFWDCNKKCNCLLKTWIYVQRSMQPRLATRQCAWEMLKNLSTSQRQPPPRCRERLLFVEAKEVGSMRAVCVNSVGAGLQNIMYPCAARLWRIWMQALLLYGIEIYSYLCETLSCLCLCFCFGIFLP